MDKIARGKDINCKWKVLTNGEASSLEGRDFKVVLHAYGYDCGCVMPFTINGNEISFTYYGKDQCETGIYGVTLWENYNKRGQTRFDLKKAFQLVETTEQESFSGEHDGFDVGVVVDLGVAGMCIGIPGLSAYDIAVNDGFIGSEHEWVLSLGEPARKAAEELKSKFNEEKTKLENNYKTKVDLLEQNYKSKIASIDSTYRAKQTALANDYEGKVSKLNNGYSTAKDNLAAEYNTAKATLKNEYDKTKANLLTEYNTAKTRLADEYNSTKRNLSDKYEQYKSKLALEYQSRYEAIATQYSNLTANLIADYAQKQKQLKEASDAAIEANKTATQKAETATNNANKAAEDAKTAERSALNATTLAENVNALLEGDEIVVTDRNGNITRRNVKGRQGDNGKDYVITQSDYNAIADIVAANFIDVELNAE